MPDKELNIEVLLYNLLTEEYQLYGEIWNYDQYVVIDIEWGDWKHEHARLNYIMDNLGFACVEEEVTEEDGSDCYSASHRFVLKDSEKIDLEKMEIIRAQDHCYWIYNNETGKYYETSVSWDKYSEEDFIEEFNKIGFKLYGNNWIDYDGDL